MLNRFIKPTAIVLTILLIISQTINAAETATANTKQAVRVREVKYGWGAMESGFKKGHEYTILSNGFTVDADTGSYSLWGDHATIDGSIFGDISKKKITVEGNAAQQIKVKYKTNPDIKNKDYIEIHSDHLIVTPNPLRKNGQDMRFTGNVELVAWYANALKVPSHTHIGEAIVELGTGDNYPKVIAKNGNGSAIPKDAEGEIPEQTGNDGSKE